MHNIIFPADVRDALKKIQISDADPASSLALQLTALTASRITPVRLAKLTDIDMDNAIWRIPAHHNKFGFEQHVPLSRDALSVFERTEHIERRDSDLVFPSSRGAVLGRNTLFNLCRKLKLDMWPHQFRTAFALWCLDSGVPQELVDVALGHKPRWLQPFQPIPTFLERRAPLMQAWADFLAGDLTDTWRWHEPALEELLKLLEANEFNSQ